MHEFTNRDGDRSTSSVFASHVIESLMQLTILNRATGSKRVRNFNVVEDERSASPNDMKSKTRKLDDSSLARLIKESFDTSVAPKSHFHTAVSSMLRMSFLVQNMSSDMRCRFYSNKILLNRSRKPNCRSKPNLNKVEENSKISSNPWKVKMGDDEKASNSSSSSKANVRNVIMAKKKILADAVILARQEHGKLVVEYDVVTKQAQEKDVTTVEHNFIDHDDKSVASSSSPATTVIDEGDTSLDTGSDVSVDEIMSVSDCGEYSDLEAEKVPQRTCHRLVDPPLYDCIGGPTVSNECQAAEIPSKLCSPAVKAISGARKPPPHSQRLSSSVVAVPAKPQAVHSGLGDEAQLELEVLAGVQLLQSLRVL
jgi:hypothetical protein